MQEAKRQVSGVVGIDGFAGPSDLTVIASAGADPEPLRLDLLAQAEHGEDSLVVAVSDDAALLDALEDAAVAVHAADMDAALAFAEALAPEHLQLAGAAAEALAPRVRSAGCLFVGIESGTAFGDYVAGSNHTLPTDGAARFASGLSARHFRRRMAEVRVGGAAAALARAGAPIARAEGFELPRPVDGDPGESAVPMTRTAQITRKTGETDVSLTLGLDGSGAGTRSTGVGFLDHMLDLLARHGRFDLEVAVTGDLQTGAHHTVEDTGIVLGQALDQALGDRRGIVRYGHAIDPDGRGARACTIDVSGPPVRVRRGLRPPAGGRHRRASSTSSRRSSSAPWRRAARLTLHLELQAGTQRPPHDRGVLQGVRPRAARRRGGRPDRDRASRRRRAR